MPYREKETVKLFYTIGEVAAMFKVNTSLIRFWEKEFDLINPRKNKKGNRLFTKDDVDNLHIIYGLVKERGFTLEGAKKKLRDDRNATIKNIELVRSLNKVREFLLEVKKEL